MTAENWGRIAAAVLAGYAVGSLPTAIWLCRFVFKIDITKVGSGNPGMTNVWRALGWKPALPVALLDAAKGALAAYVGSLITQNPAWALWAGVAAIVGHSFSFLAGFKGGKGVLTALGVFVYLSPAASLSGLFLWSVIMAWSRVVSLSSVIAASSLPVLVFCEARWHGSAGITPVFWAALSVGGFVVVRHRANLGRLLAGTEPRFRGKAS